MAGSLPNGGDPVGENFPTGPAVGEPLPTFTLPDQNGDNVDFRPADGQAMIIFYRSASW